MADTFVMRRVRPVLEGTIFGNVDFRIMPDFGEGRTVLQDAYADLRFTPALKLRAGKFKSPFGLERLVSAQDLLFVDRALPTALVPNRDVGVMLFGDVAASTVSYAVGVFNGVPDGGSADIDDSPGKDVVGRVFVAAVQEQPDEPAAAGRHRPGRKHRRARGHDGRARPADLPHDEPADLRAVSHRRRQHGDRRRQALARLPAGPVLSRLLRRHHGVRRSAHRTCARAPRRTPCENRAWQLSTSYVLTGEPAAQRIVPRRALDPKSGGWGAVEVTARYHTLELDEDFLTRWSTPATASSGPGRGTPA